MGDFKLTNDISDADKVFLVSEYVRLMDRESLEDEMYNELEMKGALDDIEYYLDSYWWRLLDNTVKERKEMDNIFWIDALYEKLGISIRDNQYYATRKDGTRLRIYWHGSDAPNAQTKLDLAIQGGYHERERPVEEDIPDCLMSRNGEVDNART